MNRIQHKFLEEQFYDNPRSKHEASISEDEMISLAGAGDQMHEQIIKAMSTNAAPKIFDFHKSETILSSIQEFMDDMQMKCFAKSGFAPSSPRRRPSIFHLSG